MRANSSVYPVALRGLACALMSGSLIALVSPAAHAVQVIDASDGVAVEAIVSIKEPTRIRIDGAAITDVFGSIHSSRCGGLPSLASTTPGLDNSGPAVPMVNPGGDVVVECDQDKGELYVRPVGDSTKPINLFISSANATYTLLLRRSDVPADTIVIRDKTPRAMRPVGSGQVAGGPSPNHIRAMKGLLVAMASDRVPADIRVEEVRQPLQLWTEAAFSLVRKYEGRGLLGEKYLLHNVGGQPMVLAEQEFDRDSGDVVGIAIENHNLRPSESTSVYVIRRETVR